MESFIQDYGYIALFLYSFGGGMLAIAIAGVFAANGTLDINLVILVAVISNIAGDYFLFYIARNNKQYAKEMMDKHQRKIDLAHKMMEKYGWGAIILQKYIYGIKTLIPLAIGLTNYDSKKFMIFNIIGAIIWGLVIGLSAYILGDIITNTLEEYKTYGIIILVSLLALLFYFFKKY